MNLRKLVIFVIMFLIWVSPIIANEYYADIDIYLKEDGSVKIEGLTNHPTLLTNNTFAHDYTSKNGKYWLLNITKKEQFSELLFRVHMPKDSKINYLKTRHLSRIEYDKSITIIGTGKNENFIILVQYSIEKQITSQSKLIYLLIFLTLILITSFLYYKKSSKNKQTQINVDLLTPRQREIVLILQKHKGMLTQSKLEKLTGFPKSSLSRNIDSLARREIIKKEQQGMSNIVILIK